MIDNDVTPFGRDYAVDLVRELMIRPKENGRRRNPYSPIVVAEGLGGSGKSLLLTTLGALMDQRVPYAVLDLETSGHATVPQILSAIAFALCRRCPGYRRLRFPRFIIGHLIMRQTLDQHNHATARAQVRSVLEKHRGVDTMVDILQQTAAGVLGVVPVASKLPIGLIDKALSAGADLVVAWRPARRVVLGKAPQWYASPAGGPVHDSIDVLIDLNQRARNDTVIGNRQYIDELMMAAFLADLRAAFARGRTARQTWNCAVLLDNADAPAHRDFLHRLDRSRRQHLAGGHKDSDPMTVVVTSRGAVTTALIGADRTAYTAADVGYAPFLRRTGDRPRAWWLRCRMSDLSFDEVGAMATTMATTMALPVGDTEQVQRMVYAATNGQPVATRLLLDAISGAPGAGVDLDEVIRRDQPDRAAGDIERGIRERLLDSVPAEARADLITCSVARDYARALHMVTQSDLLTTDHLPQLAATSAALWADAADGSATPLLRRLLQRQLAARPTDDAANWPKVHGWLAETYAREGDEIAAHHHMLARGDVTAVARHLEPLLDKLTGGELLAALDVITAAPNALDHSIEPISQLAALTADLAPRDRPFTPLARLISGLWLLADPMISSRRQALHLQIAADFATVAGFCGDGAAELLRRAQHHGQTAAWWN